MRLTNILTTIVALGTLALNTGCSHLRNLTEKDFETTRWIKYDNKGSGRIWSNYMFEDIPRSQENWAIYKDQVKKMNNDYLNGNIILPDLDSNGVVGKRVDNSI